MLAAYAQCYNYFKIINIVHFYILPYLFCSPLMYIGKCIIRETVTGSQRINVKGGEMKIVLLCLQKLRISSICPQSTIPIKYLMTDDVQDINEIITNIIETLLNQFLSYMFQIETNRKFDLVLSKCGDIYMYPWINSANNAA